MVVSTGHQHHATLLPHVDAFRQLADELHDLDAAEVARRIDGELSFVQENMIPHMEMAEHRLYPRLEQLLEDPQAMAPMRREHREVRALLEVLARYRERLSSHPLRLADELGLCRALYRLHSLMRVHLHEEEHYLALIDRHVGEAEVQELRTVMEHHGTVKL